MVCIKSYDKQPLCGVPVGVGQARGGGRWMYYKGRRWLILKRPQCDMNGESETEVTVT